MHRTNNIKCCERGSRTTKRRKFLDQTSDCQLRRKVKFHGVNYDLTYHERNFRAVVSQAVTLTKQLYHAPKTSSCKCTDCATGILSVINRWQPYALLSSFFNQRTQYINLKLMFRVLQQQQRKTPAIYTE